MTFPNPCCAAPHLSTALSHCAGVAMPSITFSSSLQSNAACVELIPILGRNVICASPTRKTFPSKKDALAEVVSKTFVKKGVECSTMAASPSGKTCFARVFCSSHNLGQTLWRGTVPRCNFPLISVKSCSNLGESAGKFEYQTQLWSRLPFASTPSSVGIV